MHLTPKDFFHLHKYNALRLFKLNLDFFYRGGRNRIRRREKWPKKSWEEGEIGGKSREEEEKEK